MDSLFYYSLLRVASAATAPLPYSFRYSQYCFFASVHTITTYLSLQLLIMVSAGTSPEKSKQVVSADSDQYGTDSSDQFFDAISFQSSQAAVQQSDAPAPNQDNVAPATPSRPALPMRSPHRVSIADANPIMSRPPNPTSNTTLAGQSARNTRIDDATITIRDFATALPASSQSHSAHRTRTPVMQTERMKSIWSDPPTSIRSAPGAIHGTDTILSPMPVPASVGTSIENRKRRRKPFASTYRWPSPIPDDPAIHLAFPVRTPAAGPYVEPPPPKWYDPILPLRTRQWWHDNVWYNMMCKGCFEDQGCFAEGGFCDNWDWTCFLACCCPLRKQSLCSSFALVTR